MTTPTITVPADRSPEKLPPLSQREFEILEGIVRGDTNGQIGRALKVSEDTVKSHARRLFHKLGARDRTHAAVRAMQLGLLVIDGLAPTTAGPRRPCHPDRAAVGPSVRLRADHHDAALLRVAMFGPTPTNPAMAHERSLAALHRLVGA